MFLLNVRLSPSSGVDGMSAVFTIFIHKAVICPSPNHKRNSEQRQMTSTILSQHELCGDQSTGHVTSNLPGYMDCSVKEAIQIQLHFNRDMGFLLSHSRYLTITPQGPKTSSLNPNGRLAVPCMAVCTGTGISDYLGQITALCEYDTQPQMTSRDSL